MKLNFSHERVMAVVAHPDDAELLCAGTLARARDDGAVVAICVMCQGDRGQSNPPIRNLGQVRKREMTAAAKLLKAKLYTAGYSDGHLEDRPATRSKLIEIMRKFKPTLVLAHDPNDYHMDHQAAAKIAEAASWFCASAGHKTTTVAMASPPAVWLMDTLNMLDFEPGFFVDVTNYRALKSDMLRCHKSQVARACDGDLPALMDLMDRQGFARGEQANTTYAEAFRVLRKMKRLHAW